MSESIEETEQVQELINSVSLIDMRIELFKRKDFRFIVEGISKDGELVFHEKQNEALNILTDDTTEELLYGGSIGGGKTYLGANWILFMCLLYPGTKWFIARNELGKLIESSFRTLQEVCRKYGFEDYKFNANKNHITFGNGSMINLIEVKYKPSDPMFEALGSIEYTGGWIEEGGEIHEEGYKKLMERIGRWRNEEYGITRTMFITCNPKRNWMYRRYYQPYKKGTLSSFCRFLEALITDNVFLGKKYIEGVIRNYEGDKVGTERLIKGNWDYEENPFQLAEQEMIDMVFSNDHVKGGKKYITADVARFGSDKARIGAWDGWNLIDVISLDVSKTTDVELAILTFRRKYNVPKNRVIIDADGVGGGVVDGTGGIGFNNGGRPIKENKETPNYKNLQVQCLYTLADKINDGGLNITADLTSVERDEIKAEFSQIQSKGDQDPERKLDCKSKGDIKNDIGRSPDWRDMIMMRAFFDLKKTNRFLVSRVPK